VALLVAHPGHFTTVQDLGRPGYREWGVPVAGAFDRSSCALANALLGNSADSAVLELTLFGGTYEAEINLAIALAGAPMDAVILTPNGQRRPLRIPQSANLLAGDRIVLGRTGWGARTYLAVRGGLRTPLVLDSRSQEARIRAGDRLPAGPGRLPVRRPVEPALKLTGQDPIRVIHGPDAARMTTPGALEDHLFLVGADSDRMGLRLEGAPLDAVPEPDRISMPICPGALQRTDAGLIVLGVACGTMGGYPHVAHVISADLDRLGQLRPGERVRFRRITLEEARRLDEIDRHDQLVRIVRTTALALDSGFN
jgi:biotin-dependent carboxylase-like uncharacterized protein